MPWRFGSTFLLLIRHGGRSPPAGQCDNPAVPWLWHDRRCHLLHKWRGVGRGATERRGPGELHSGTRWCPRGMESFKGKNAVLHSPMSFINNIQFIFALTHQVVFLVYFGEIICAIVCKMCSMSIKYQKPNVGASLAVVWEVVRGDWEAFVWI